MTAYLFIFTVLFIGLIFIATEHLDHHRFVIMIRGTVIWIFQCSNALKICKETDRILHRMLIYEIVRYIMDPMGKFRLSCTFPSRIGSINVTVIWERWPNEVFKFELNPETSIKVSVPFIQRHGWVFESIICAFCYIYDL